MDKNDNIIFKTVVGIVQYKTKGLQIAVSFQEPTTLKYFSMISSDSLHSISYRKYTANERT